MKLLVQIGGYYAIKNTQADDYGVVRLLNMDSDVWHYQTFRERFSYVPRSDQVVCLKPLVRHADGLVSELLEKSEVLLVGGRDLSEDDLSEYGESEQNFLVMDAQGLEKALLALRLLSRERPAVVVISRTSRGIVAHLAPEAGRHERIGIDFGSFVDELAISPEGLSNRLEFFLRTNCEADPDNPDDIVDLLLSPAGKEYLHWLPGELREAAANATLTPEVMEDFTGIVFRSQTELQAWVGSILTRAGL